MSGEEFIPDRGGPIGHGPLRVGEIVFAGGLDRAVQRHVFHDFELSHLSLRVLRLDCCSVSEMVCIALTKYRRQRTTCLIENRSAQGTSGQRSLPRRGHREQACSPDDGKTWETNRMQDIQRVQWEAFDPAAPAPRLDPHRCHDVVNPDIHLEGAIRHDTENSYPTSISGPF